MTLLVFPNFQGLKQAQSKRPEIKSQLFENPLSGRESRVRFQLYPKYHFKINIEFLLQNVDQQDSAQLIGFMAQIGGKTDAFLYLDPTDSQVVYQVIGAGNGTQTTYQLTRALGDFSEAIHNPLADSVSVYVDVGEGFAWVNPDDYTLFDTGLVTFDTAPANNAVVAWSGQYYFRVRLEEDGYDVNTLFANIGECPEVGFVGSVRNIV